MFLDHDGWLKSQFGRYVRTIVSYLFHALTPSLDPNIKSMHSGVSLQREEVVTSTVITFPNRKRIWASLDSAHHRCVDTFIIGLSLVLAIQPIECPYFVSMYTGLRIELK